MLQKLKTQVKSGDYLVKPHATLHALKEGFDELDIVDAVLSGRIVEEYPEERRVLICGKTDLSKNVVIYLHVVCEYRDSNYVEFVTAYIPDETQWYPPDFMRRKRKR